ncbi:LOW QUALITY PROTEIN: mothers against decapentaplegic homolog 6-like [Centruroides vittatus]|uniref:LOW QUALITY PROTEIN: mothers against decapentaplegic homolog 6-like n=1 Tax=Centruroides vittatus TaxID=120091 RepID=UPI003510C1C3
MVQNMLKRLKESQLELLVQAVESRSCDVTGCALVPRGDLRLGRRTLPLHVLCCQLWRRPDVRQPFELKWLHWCDTANDPLYICCNPYHWSQLCKPELPPPPYARHARKAESEAERMTPVAGLPSSTAAADTFVYFEGKTFDTEDRGSHPPSYPTTGENRASDTWCSVTYWELRTRVGRLFPVSGDRVDGFSELPHGDGLCLAMLAELHSTGPGVSLSREADSVWLYNRSDHPVFVNSPTLKRSKAGAPTVYKVPPGYSIKIFDYHKSEYRRARLAASPTERSDGPIDPNSVRVSFAKGWKPKYLRQFVTSCPCWLEVLLARLPRCPSLRPSSQTRLFRRPPAQGTAPLLLYIECTYFCHDFCRGRVACATAQASSSTKGDVEIVEYDSDKGFIKIHNKGNKVLPIGGWQLVQKTSEDEGTSFKFQRNTTSSHAYVTVWSSDSGTSHSPPRDSHEGTVVIPSDSLPSHY